MHFNRISLLRDVNPQTAHISTAPLKPNSFQSGSILESTNVFELDAHVCHSRRYVAR